ncbi:zinc metalloprotease HtpX [Crenalkalicoccus roseus]|uniref:zinc metalloprotease HtpX n=1 Tax=Crenalkalicoccus roseus TaxID=1485588 RepID=UPI0013053081|nr:zinc metalloprotease HtpX [Crenalkalicoccus roseus]
MWRASSFRRTPVAYLRLDPAALARQRRLNRLQSALLLLGLTALAGLTGLAAAGVEGLVLAAAGAALFLLLDPAPGDPLFRHVFGAARLAPAQAPELFALLDELARRAGLSRAPTLYLIPSPMLQAMAAGSREKPAIAVTLGLLRALPPRELAAVLAHEVAHLRHGDVAVMRLAAAAAALSRTMATLGIVLLALWLPALLALGQAPSPLAVALLVAAPLIGDLLTLSLSRRREFLADAGAVELTGDPLALSAALARIQRLQGDDWERMAARGPRWLRWFRTHPTVEERIARLAATVAPVQVAPPAWDWAPGGPARLGHLGGTHPAQRLARRWLL